MKIAVVGAGAIGTLLAAIWQRSGRDVMLIVRSGRTPALEAGLTLSGVAGDGHVTIPVATELPTDRDVVVLTPKLGDLEAACRVIASRLGGALVVTTQNGVRGPDIVRDALGVEPIHAIVQLNASALEPGRVHYHRRAPTVLGVARGVRHRLPALAALFADVAPVVVRRRIEDAMWSKLVINTLTNSVNALTGMPVATCIRDRGAASFAVALVREALAVLRAAAVRIANLPGAPVQLLALAMWAPAWMGRFALRRSLDRPDQQTLVTSTLQSLLRRRPTEIDYLSGELVRLGAAHSTATPIHTAIVEQIRRIEAGGAFLAPDQLAGLISTSR